MFVIIVLIIRSHLGPSHVGSPGLRIRSSQFDSMTQLPLPSGGALDLDCLPDVVTKEMLEVCAARIKDLLAATVPKPAKK